MKYLKIIIEIVLIILLILNLIPDKKNDILIKVSDLELKIDSLNLTKDSIRTVIDSTHVRIVTNEKHYQERINTIIAQPDSFSELYTRQYILNFASSRGINIRGTREIE